MAEYSRLARGSFISTGATQIINLPFQPDRIEMTNFTKAATTAISQNIVTGVWDASMAQGTAVIQGYDPNPALIYDVVSSNGISTFSAGLSLQYGPQLQIASTTLASSTITTAAPHGLSTGDVVILQGLYQSATTGSPQISGMPFVISVTSPSAFTINWNMNQSNFTALSGSPAGAFVRKVLNPFLYAPGDAFISSISTGSTTTIITTDPHNFVVGQEIGFRIPASYGTTELNELPNTIIPGSPMNYFVTSVTNSTTFVCNANTTSATAFNSNQTVASVPGLSFPQVFAVGDVNTGGVAYSGGVLYPSPVVNGSSTINGPAINGAFVNNTNQGFIIGTGAGRVLTTGSLVGANADVIFWQAFLHDMSL